MQDYRFSDAVESFSDKLTIFDGPAQEVAVLGHKKVRFYPDKISNDPDAPVQVDVDGNSGGYLDGSNMELTVEAKIVDEAGNDCADTDGVTFANQGLHTFFSSVVCKLNDVEVNPNVGTLHGVKNYLETLCFKSEEVKNSLGHQKGYYADSTLTVGVTDPLNAKPPINTGVAQRFTRTKKSALVTLKGTPGVDWLERCGKLILNGCTVRFEFYQQRDSVRLLAKDSAKKYSLRITNLYITACIAKIRPEMLIRHSQLLADGKKATYPFPRTVMRSFNIPAGDASFSMSRLMSDRVPSLILLVLEDSAGFGGKYENNIYNFEHFGLTSAKLSVDNQVVPQSEFRPDFDGGKYAEEYAAFLALTRGRGNSVTREQFASGNTVLVFDMQGHTNMEEGFFPVINKGFTTLDLTFKTKLTNAVTGVLYMTLPAMFRITQARNVEVEY